MRGLPAAVADDPERLARFQREAELLAALNHPHTAQIYGLERSGATTALVMELVEGPTLADRIAQGPAASSASAICHANERNPAGTVVGIIAGPRSDGSRLSLPVPSRDGSRVAH